MLCVEHSYSTGVETISVSNHVSAEDRKEKCDSMIICDLSGFECDFFLKWSQEISAKFF